MAEESRADLDFEAAMNERYLALISNLPNKVRGSVVGPANTGWTGTGRVKALVFGYGPLAARIGLREPDQDLGTAFYIGARRVRRGTFEAEVVSWDAPIARVFYNPADCDHEIMGSIVGRRSLLTAGNVVVRVFDDWVNGQQPAESPFALAQLIVPRAPSTGRSGGRALRRAGSSGTGARLTPAGGGPLRPFQEPQQPPTVTKPQARATRAPSSIEGDAAANVRTGMRAADSVDYALTRPRSHALQSLLATLQPDQYEMITARPDRALLLQGHPGTGKSVIAIHRAAYLVSPVRIEDESQSSFEWPRSVLFVGPTSQWRQHVERAVHALADSRAITVMSISETLAKLARIKLGTTGPDPSLDDAARFVHAVARKAVRAARAEELLGPHQSPSEVVDTVYEIVRSGGTRRTPLDFQMAHTKSWIKTLPIANQARQQARCQGIFAAIGACVFAGHPRFDHIIVDEAQDVSGLEWSLLRQLNPRENWTLVGDMNQRRNDYVDSSWAGIADRLFMGSVKPRILERGYRSTQPMLDFAKALLRREERAVVTLQQDGPPVRREPVKTSRGLGSTALAEAIRLRESYPNGTVAIIAAAPELVRDELVKSNWRQQDEGNWVKSGESLRLLTHVTSRGIEFDGVVVVEPANFPQNFGRSGPLYTSLTRANRELVVVHHAPLPDPLRRHNRARRP